MSPVDEMLGEMDPLDPTRELAEWDREFLREVGHLPAFSPLVSLHDRRRIKKGRNTDPEQVPKILRVTPC